jgi:hypothetical protein
MGSPRSTPARPARRTAKLRKPSAPAASNTRTCSGQPGSYFNRPMPCGSSRTCQGRRCAPGFKLCGCHFGLALRREHWFETSWQAFELSPSCNHPGPVVSVVGHGTPSWVRRQLGYNPTIADYRAAMGIDWMNRDELSQAIPPAYTEYIGYQLIAALELAG